MDIKDYISSGVLESFVLGIASGQERREIECLSSIYPEIQQSLDELSEVMESFAYTLATEPPAHLKTKILEAIVDEAQEPLLQPLNEVKPTPTQQEVQPAAMTVSKPNRPWLAAASLAALVALTVVFFINQNNQQQELIALQEKVNTSEQFNTELNDLNSWLAHSRTKKIQLKGTENQPEAEVAVFWNDLTQDVAFKVGNLPALASDKDYQLWAIVDGKPTDMGVMDYKNALAEIVQGGKVAGAQAFAITIEPKGGSKNPTLTAMVVVGNV